MKKLSVAVFVEMSNKVLKKKYQKNYPDIIKLYRTDTFWSKSTDMYDSKPYSYEIKDNIIYINGNNPYEFSEFFFGQHVNSIKRNFIDNPERYIGEYRAGYLLFEVDDSSRYSIPKGLKPIETVYTNVIRCDEKGNVEMLGIEAFRDEKIENILSDT